MPVRSRCHSEGSTAMCRITTSILTFVRMLYPVLKVLAVLACCASVSWVVPFALDKPTRTYTLPEELLEISALTDVDEHTVACVQDEQAMMYLLDLRSGAITQRMPQASAASAPPQGLA
ncbi:MAG: hypothetical protein ACK46C_04030 [Flavobacteriales bacterium]